MDGRAFPRIDVRCDASGCRGGAELPCDRKHQRAPLLLRRGVSSKNEKASRDQYRLIIRRQGSIPCGRSPNRRKAEKYLPRLLSFTDRMSMFSDVCAPIQRANQMTKEGATGRRVARQRKRALQLAGAAIDDRADSSASSRDKSTRKQRLLQGPAEFRGVRVDRSNKTSSDDE